MSLMVGIDASYTGFGLVALQPVSGLADIVTLKFDPAKFGSGIDRLIAIEQALAVHLTAWHEADPIEHVCLEGYAMASKFGREKAGELGAIVKRTLHEVLPDPVGYPTIVAPFSLKKFITGKASASKNVIIKDVLRKWGRDLDDDNAADAYGLAQIAKALTFGAELAYEKTVLDNLTRFTERRE